MGMGMGMGVDMDMGVGMGVGRCGAGVPRSSVSRGIVLQ